MQTDQRVQLRSLTGGFSLILAVVIAAAASAALASMYSIYLSSKVPAAISKKGDIARSIAESGLEVGIAYLQENIGVDFDGVLDPGLIHANCPTPPFPSAPTGYSDYSIPSLSGGSAVTYLGKAYTMVPYNGGAYLMRFDDDQDDFVKVDSWSSATNNSIATGDPDCKEGPTLLSGSDNPARDCNKTVWMTVVGIYPGTDPDKAEQREVLRRLHVAVGPPTIAGIKCKGDISTQGAARLFGCSPIGSVEVAGDVDASGGSVGCFCGESRAASFSGWNHCNDPALTTNCGTFGVGCAEGSIAPPAPTVPTIGNPVGTGADGADYYIDWTRSCVFFMDIDNLAGHGVSLWFWDAAADRGPFAASCASFEGLNISFSSFWSNLPGIPGPPRTQAMGDPEAWQRCWTPLIFNMETTACTWRAPGPSEIDLSSGVCGWAPNNNLTPVTPWTIAANQDSASPPNAWATDGMGYAGINGTTVNKPQWANACRFSYPPYPDATTPAKDVHCTSCDGTHLAVVYDAIAGSDLLSFRGATENEINAIPAGVYIYPHGNKIVAHGGMNAAITVLGPTDTTDYFHNYPRASIIYGPGSPPNTVPNLQAATGSDFWFGVGQAWGNPAGTGASYFSIAADSEFTMHGTTKSVIGGSIYVSQGDFDWNGGNLNWLYGELHLNDNINFIGSADFLWRYATPLQEMPPKVGSPPNTTLIPQ